MTFSDIPVVYVSFMSMVVQMKTTSVRNKIHVYPGLRSYLLHYTVVINDP